MCSAKISLVVIRTSNLDRAIAFYRTLGLSFNEEKHGNGPVHFSCELDNLVLEIYPGKETGPIDYKSSGATMLGFNVPSVDDTVTLLQQLGFQVVNTAKDSPWGRRAVVLDADGRAIDISEFTKS